MQSDQFLTSKEFYNSKCPSVVWEMRLYPNFSCKRTFIDGYNVKPRSVMVSVPKVSLNLKSISNFNGTLRVKYNIYALDANSKRVAISGKAKAVHDFQNQTQVETSKLEIDLQKTSHPDGSILLYCEIEFIPYGIKCVDNIIDDYSITNTSQKSFNNMFKQGILTDCVIKVGDEQINTHRCVLANNSVVFHRMFEQENMIEAKNGEINIVDSSPKCVRALLDYFYNREINKKILEKLVYELYAIAHKYEVKSLMDKCEHIMASKVDVNSFAENLKYIHIYNLPILEKACVTFITTNRMTFLDSKEWKDLKQLYKDKAIDLLEAAFKNC